MIEVERDFTSSGEITYIRMSGESLRSDDGETWFLPKRLVSPEMLVKDLPDDAMFEVCDRAEESIIIRDSPVTIRVERIDDNHVQVAFEDFGTRKYWDGAVTFKSYMEAKRDAVQERAKEVGDLRLDEYDDDGAWIHLAYSTRLSVEKVHTAIELAEQIGAEIEGAVDLRLGAELWAPVETDNEKDFTLRTVLPILRRLGFQNVRYHHGKREFGRDVIFARFTEFQDLEHWAAQVKCGDVSGGANSEIDGMLGQIDDAFKMPFYDLYTRQQQRIAKLAIIISGRFTENAIEKICEKIESHAMLNNLIFVDAEKIQTLAERFTRRRKT